MSANLLELPFMRAGVECVANAEVTVNDDPAARGCSEWARGFPVLTATLSPPARGYADWLGWIQIVEATDLSGEFRNDPFEPLGGIPAATYPFCFFGFAPTLLDAPHRGHRDDMRFLAHSFLCGLGPDPLGPSSEIDALLGFSWGFRIRDGEILIDPLARLGSEEWDAHRPYLRSAYPRWDFLPGFR